MALAEKISPPAADAGPDLLSKNALDRQFEDRRQSERISARLAVRVSILKPTQHEFYTETFDELRRRFLIAVEYSRLTLVGRRALKSLRAPQPEIGVFASTLERRLEMLSTLSGLPTHLVSSKNQQTVFLNASGMKFAYPDAIEPNSLVCLRLVSFKSPMLALITLATVVHNSVERDEQTGAHVGVAVRFDKIHADDLPAFRSFVSLSAGASKSAASG